MGNWNAARRDLVQEALKDSPAGGGYGELAARWSLKDLSGSTSGLGEGIHDE